MKALYVHRTQGKGVELVHIEGIINAFRHSGWRVKVIGPPGVRIDGKKKCSGLYTVFSGRASEFVFEIFELLYNFVSFFRLFLRLGFGRYDLVYERYSLFNFAAVAAGKIFKVPVIIEVNDSANIYRSRKLVLKKTAKWFEKRILNASRLVVTISEEFKLRLTRIGVMQKKIIVTPNAVDREKWQDVQRTPPNDNVVRIIFVAAFVRWHRPDFMIRAFSQLLQNNYEVELLMVGDGPGLPSAQKICHELGIGERVFFTGRLESPDVQKLLLASDIGVMAHSNAHGSPMKIFEYMAGGLAVVAPRFSPIQEVLEDHVTGLMFEPLNLCDLVDCLSLLILDHELRDQIAQSARAAVMKEHTWDDNLSKVLYKLQQYPPLREVSKV